MLFHMVRSVFLRVVAKKTFNGLSHAQIFVVFRASTHTEKKQLHHLKEREKLCGKTAVKILSVHFVKAILSYGERCRH